MQEYHFFPDTNFFIDLPDFHSQFFFDYRPCAIVVCDPVLLELDRLKRTPDAWSSGLEEWDRHIEKKVDAAFHARQAIRAINAVLDGEVSLPQHVRITRYHERQDEHSRSADEEILLLAQQYAQENENVDVVLLTGDINLRNLAHGTTIEAIGPDEWQVKRRRAQWLRLALALDDPVQQAHDECIRLRQQLTQLEDSSGSQAQQLQAQIWAAEAKEESELGRFQSDMDAHTRRVHWGRADEALREADQQYVHLKEELDQLDSSSPPKELAAARKHLKRAFQRVLVELKRHDAEKAAKLAQEQAKLREAQRNKYRVELPDIVQSPNGELTYPIETSDFETVGQILVNRYWWYLEQHRDDLVCTLHVHANVREDLASELLVVSAADRLEYSPPSSYKLISPSNRVLAQITAGSWKIVVEAKELETNWKPLLRLPQYRYGTSPAFASLELSIVASEMSPEEIQLVEQARRIEEQQPKVIVEKKLPIPQERKQKSWWLLTVLIPIAFLALAFLTPAFLCTLSMILNALITLLSR